MFTVTQSICETRVYLSQIKVTVLLCVVYRSRDLTQSMGMATSVGLHGGTNDGNVLKNLTTSALRGNKVQLF